MTKHEYIARQQAMMRSANKRITVMVIVFFGALLGIIPLGNYIERHEELFWLDKILAPILLLVLLLLFGCFFWLMWRHQVQFGLCCPHCGKRILNSRLAIAAGSCGYCGEKLFDEVQA